MFPLTATVLDVVREGDPNLFFLFQVAQWEPVLIELEGVLTAIHAYDLDQDAERRLRSLVQGARAICDAA